MSSAVALVNQSIDMRPRVSTPSQYTWRRIAPESTVTADLNSAFQAQFKIPSGLVVNLAKSILRFRRTTTAVNHTFLFSGCLPISGLDAVSQRGIVINSNQRLRHWSKLSAPLFKDSRTWMGSAGISFAGEASDGMDRSDALYDAGASRFFNNTGVPSGEGMSYFNLKQYDYSAAGGVARNYAIPGQSMWGTIMTCESNLYLGGESLTLNFTLPPTVEIGFTAADADAGTPAALAAADTISNVEFLLAIETNPDIVQSLISTVNAQGLQIPYQSVQEFADVTDTSTSYSRQYQLDVSRGSSLQLIVSGLALSNETLRNRLNFYNGAGVKWSSIRAYVNNKALSDYPLDRDLLYMQMRESVLENSIVPVRSANDAYGVVCFDFCGLSAADLVKNSKLTSGLDLTQAPVTVQLDWVKTGAAYRAFTFAIVSRKLVLNPQASGGGISVLNV
jgi:hypothetical protein